MTFDYVIIGCGMYGSVFARSVADAGRSVLIVDRRDHIGGNCFTREEQGVHVHAYGAHIFHTNSRSVWDFVNRFAEFNHYRHRLYANYRGRILSFPINLMTLAQIWGVSNPAEAEARLALVREPIEKPRNLEEWCLSQVGRELYETFVQGYTAKQWGREPRELPSSIIRRIPIRLNYNDNYFDDQYQGIPIGGYTAMFQRMLEHPRIRVETGVDFREHRDWLLGRGERLVYSGMIDEFFDYRHGPLEYRSLRFEHETRSGDFQGSSVVNYTAADVPFTRILEHKHFDPSTKSPATVITREYPEQYSAGKNPYYPIRDDANTELYDRYRELARDTGVIFGGRLGTYRYFDMHQVVAQAMADAEEETQVILPIRKAA